ncbi:MAG: gamma-glutamyltransferase family protein [Candidatus Eremiobacteraeota bacterium]|nr:gamma-glutamyltransferase family protein [Candidatus Eremiobacteraeota bacterium]
MLRRGGNAVDAAIATNAVLAVVYPASCGIGGAALWLVYEPKTGDTIAYNGSGRASAALDVAFLRARGYQTMPTRGPFSVTTPGCVRSWEDVALAHGTCGLDQLLLPAETYARGGFVATDTNAYYFTANEPLLRADADAAAIFLARGVPRAGDLIRNEPLADSLGAIRREGARAFYEGPIARAICATLQELGNPMTLDDLAAQTTERQIPLGVEWHGARIVAHPPNSQAAVAPIVMGMLTNDGAASDLEWTHLAVEAIKIAFDERDTRFADPAAMSRPIDDLLFPASLAAARARIDTARAAERRGPSDRGGTIAVVAVDADGRAVSLIESLYMNFGSGIVARGTGIFLQNRGAYFRLDETHPNALGGRKRPLHTLSPGMLLRDGKPEFIYGTMGGDGQPQTHVQLIHAMYEREMSVQEAIDAPRFVYGRDSESAFADSVRVESRFPAEIVAGLRARNHAVEVLGPYEHALGHAHGIVVDWGRGTLAGGADPRADSLALGT